MFSCKHAKLRTQASIHDHVPNLEHEPAKDLTCILAENSSTSFLPDWLFEFDP